MSAAKTITIEGDLAHLLEGFRRASAKRREASVALDDAARNVHADLADADKARDAEIDFRSAFDAELAAAHTLALSVSNRADW